VVINSMAVLSMFGDMGAPNSGCKSRLAPAYPASIILV